MLLEKAHKFDIEALNKKVDTLLPTILFENFHQEYQDTWKLQELEYSDLSIKVDENFEMTLQSVKSNIKTLSCNLKDHLANMLRKEFVIHSEFEYQMNKKADSEKYDIKISKKSNQSETIKNIQHLKFVEDQLEQTVILFVEICMLNQTQNHTKQGKYIHEQAQKILDVIKSKSNYSNLDSLMIDSSQWTYDEFTKNKALTSHHTQGTINTRPFSNSLK